MDRQLSYTRGSLVVFEGLDKAGKSTQIQAFRDAVGGSCPQFVHMPSGLTDSTRKIYGALEEGGITSALGKQLFHLACHAENISAIETARNTGAVVLDRFWWSTVAYGWYGGRLEETGLDKASFMQVISTIWGKLAPDLIFLFLDPREQDANNSNDVDAGYRALAEEFPTQTVFVPKLSVEETTDFIIESLEAHGLVSWVAPLSQGDRVTPLQQAEAINSATDDR